MKVNHYECDECGHRVRRITVHISEFTFGDQEDWHFCGTLCMDKFIRNVMNEHFTPDAADAIQYQLSGQDLRDGA